MASVKYEAFVRNSDWARRNGEKSVKKTRNIILVKWRIREFLMANTK